MYNQTLCLIRRNSELLMLNRTFPPALGLWNGVGGKSEGEESPLQCVIREVFEETRIDLTEFGIHYKGVVTWEVDGNYSGGMHVFLVDIPGNYIYETPVGTKEGVLDWKSISWILERRNYGVGEMIPHYLPGVLYGEGVFEYHCILENGILVRFEQIQLSK